MRNDQLLVDLHANLWVSLRHVFNTDRVLLGVTYGINFAGFAMLGLTTARRPPAAVITITALLALNGLIMLSLKNSRREALAILKTLVQLYKDHELGSYFDESTLEYYRKRYSLWLVLAPTVCAIAIVLGLVVGW